MARTSVITLSFFLTPLALAQTEAAKQEAASVYDFTVNSIDGKPVPLSSYKGQVLLIINVASECGLTEDQYSALEPLYQKYKDRGFRVLAFPANNFGEQEPGSNQEIKEFCTKKYGATYDLFEKVSVKGDDQCALYKFLTNEQASHGFGGEVQWNFQKYIVDAKGNVVAKFDPRTKPNDAKVVEIIERELAAG